MLPLSLSLPTPHAKFRALGKLRAPVFCMRLAEGISWPVAASAGSRSSLEGANLGFGCCCLQATNVASRQQFVAVHKLALSATGASLRTTSKSEPPSVAGGRLRWDALVAIYLALRRSFFCEVSPVTHCRCHGSPITSRVWPPLKVFRTSPEDLSYPGSLVSDRRDICLTQRGHLSYPKGTFVLPKGDICLTHAKGSPPRPP